MKKKIIISLLLVIAIVLISVTCGLHVTAYNNTSKTNTVFVIDENGKATVGVSYTGYKDITTHAEISVKIQKEGAPENEFALDESFRTEGSGYDGEFTCQLLSRGDYVCTVVYTVFGSGGAPDVIEYSAVKACNFDEKDMAMPGMENVDFGGYKFVFCGYINATDGWRDYEVYAEEEASDTVEKAIAERNEILSRLYNCSIEVKDADAGTFLPDHLTNQYDYDIANLKHNIFTHGDNRHYNFHELDIDLGKPWWDANFVNDLTVDGKLYAISGAFSLSSFDAAWALYFNRGVLESLPSLKGTDLYSLVEKDEWTFDKMFEISRLAAEDSEIYGFVSSSYGVRALYFGMGQSYLEKTDGADGVTEFRHGFTDAAKTATDRILELYADESALLTSYSSVHENIKGGGALFAPYTLGVLGYYTDKNGADVGLLPIPKASSAQTDYDHIAEYKMVYTAVPKGTTDAKMLSDFLTLYAYHSYHTVYPAYLEKVAEYTGNEKDSRMAEIIINSRSFDIAFNSSWAGEDTEYLGSVRSGTNKVTELAKTVGKAIEEAALEYKKRIARNN